MREMPGVRYRLAYRHVLLTRDDGRMILFRRRRFMPWSRKGDIWLKRGEGYLWEKIPLPQEDGDWDEWVQDLLRG